MLSIHDVNGYVALFGSNTAVGIFKTLANKFKLENLRDFFEKGYSINIAGLITDIEKMDMGFTELDDVKINLLEVLGQCKEIVLLSNDNE